MGKPLGLILLVVNFLFPELIYSQAPLQKVVVTSSSAGERLDPGRYPVAANGNRRPR